MAVTPTDSARPDDQPELDVRRNLLLSFPSLDIAHDGRDVIDSVVEGTICHLLSRMGVDKIVILHEVAVGIRDLAGLTYEDAELVAAFERLEAKGKLSFRDDRHRSFVYVEDAYRTSHDAFQLRMSAWDTVRRAWMDEVARRHDLAEHQTEALWEALDEFASRLMNAYAAEAAAFLYLNDATGKARFYAALQARLPEVSETVPPELLKVAVVEFPRFFDSSHAARTDYLTARLRAAFFFHLLSLDPSASQLVREQVEEKALYLDSNFLFRLIGFHGPARAFTPITVVEVSKQLNCRLLVAQETVDEFLRVIKANVSRLRSTPITREAYLRVAAEHPSDEGEFMAAYYRELQSGRVKSPEEFGRKWSNIHTFLKQWGITIDEEMRADEEDLSSDEFRDEVSRLQQWHGGQKKLDAIYHDVFMLRLIRELRGPIDATSAQVRVWLLTSDRKLTKYAAYYATDEHLPGALLADHWLQIARPFLPRTDDYAKSFVAMLHHPLLFQGSTKIPFQHMAEMLSRLERYQELPEPVVAAMVADDEFTRRFMEAKSEQDARSLIELKAGEVAAAAMSQNQILADQVGQMRHQLATLAEDVDILRDTRAQLTRERDAARETAVIAVRETEDRLRRELGAQLTSAVESAIKATSVQTRQQLEPEFAARLSAARLWTAYWCFAGIVTIGGLVALAIGWDNWSGAQRVMIIAGIFALDLALLMLPRGPSWTLGILASLAGIMGVAPVVRETWLASAKRGDQSKAVVAPAGGRPDAGTPASSGRDSARSPATDSAPR